MEPASNSDIETQINQISGIEPIAPTVFRCKDDGFQNTLIKIHISEEKTYEDVKLNHDKHVELLGQEFVQEQVPIKIDNPELVAKIKKHILETRMFYAAEGIASLRSAVELQGFVTEERNTGNNIWDFIIKNYPLINPNAKGELIVFLEKLQEVNKNGWVFDIPDFPSSERNEEEITQRNYDNCIVDEKGPTFIDTSHIWVADTPGNILLSKKQSLSIQVALDLLRGRTSLEESFKVMKEEKEKFIRGIKQT